MERLENDIIFNAENTNRDTIDYDALVNLAAELLRDGGYLPDYLATFAADVLEGKQKRPTRRGPDPYANWQRDISYTIAVVKISNHFDLPRYTNNELSNQITAAQIVAESVHVSLNVVHKAIRKHGSIVGDLISPQVPLD